MRNRILIGCGAVALSLSAPAGATYTWTGAADNYWTNAANWTVGGAAASVSPGVVWDGATGTPALPTQDTAVFDGTCTDAARTTVDLSGLYSVGTVRVEGADAPKYTFGTGLDQFLPFETNGLFTVASTVPAANCPTINANLAFMSNVDCSWWTSAALGRQFTYENQTEGRLTLKGTFGTPKRRLRPGAGTAYRELNVKMSAPKGTLVFEGQQYCYDDNWLVSLDYYVKRIEIVGCAFESSKLNQFYQSCTISVGPGATFGYFSGNNAGIGISNASTVRIEGEGTFRFASNAGGASYDNHAYLAPGNNSTLDVSTAQFAHKSTTPQSNQRAPKAIFTRGDQYGFVRLNAETPGDLLAGFYLSGNFNLEITSVAQLERCEALWLCATNKFYTLDAWKSWNANYAYFKTRWTGTADETFTTAVTNYDYATPQVFTLENRGSARLTAAMPYFAHGAQTSLALDGATAPIVYGVDMKCAAAPVTLSGDIVFTNGVDLSGASVIRLNGARLTVEDAAALETLPPVVVADGANTIILPDDDLVVTNLTRTAGTLDVTSPGRRTLVVPNLTGDVSWLTYTGDAAGVGSGGLVWPKSAYAVTQSIPAHGGTVPNDAEAFVAIATAGEAGAGDVTLAADAAEVNGLVEVTREPATVEIGAAQTLTAGIVAREKHAGSLTLGATAGEGTLAAGADGLVLDNASDLDALTVNAALTAPETTVRVTGAGETVLRGGTKADAGVQNLLVPNGTAVFADGTYEFNRFLVATNWEKAVSSAVVTNATVRLSPGKGHAAGGIGGLYSTSSMASEPFARFGGSSSLTNSLVLRDGGRLETVGPFADIQTVFYDRTFHVGLNGFGVMEVGDGGAFEGRLLVGGWPDTSASKCYWGDGAVYQNGGSVTVWGTTGSAYSGSSGLGGYLNSSCGYYALRGGLFTSHGCFTVAFYGYRGIFDQTAGSSVFTNNGSSAAYLLIGATNTGCGRVRVRDSKMDVYGTVSMLQSWSGGAYSDLIVEGPEGEVNVSGNIRMMSGRPGADNRAQATVSVVNGARIAFRRFEVGNNAAGCTSTVHYAVMNFDGGTWKALSQSGQPLVDDYIPDYPTFREFLVGPRGATIEVPANLKRYANLPFSAPQTGVVTGVTGFEPFFCARVCPSVLVENGSGSDGYGAVAFAEYDSDRQMVTNITVYAGGTGYTSAKVKVMLGQSTVKTYDAVISEPDTSGSFTKAGGGELVFSVANTYGGETVLKEGTLTLEAANALPEGTTVVYDGGALRTTVAAAPARLTLRLANPQRRQTVLSYTDAEPSVLPAVTILNEGRWRAKKVGRTIRVTEHIGNIIFLR